MNDPSIKHGTLGGTFITLLTIAWTDVEKTILLSATGATVSFFISLFLRKLTKSKKDA